MVNTELDDEASVVTADEVSSVSGDETATPVHPKEEENRKLRNKVAKLEKENAVLRAFYEKHTGGAVVGQPVQRPSGTDSMSRLRRSLIPQPSAGALEKLTDSMMKELAATLPFLPIKKVSSQVYTLDTPHKKHKVTVHSGALVVRLGCGYEDVLTFLEKRAKIVRSR
eukprot:TRINITY_DN24796_c0_g1_i1.p1 TRINITY_DN24796_c0_g1~~TRINITY_DN24796_c0_g1_i1.p1  ORF type:complete len:187 (+),score=37.47 TRINITY_DN24796_c0_g1_i1:59-562(+)